MWTLPLAIALCQVVIAHADTNGAISPSLQEVVVTALKQDSPLQKVPVAVTALSAKAFRDAGVITPLDLNGQAPSLVITTSEGYNMSVAIRGIGFDVPQEDSAQPSVSYHEDGIYIANPVALNSGFLDVDRVEVLRGPQGTVFGQNSLGGTINVISVQPTFDAVRGYIDASTGSYALAHTTAALNVPMSDSFAVRAAFDQDYQHGFATATAVSGFRGGYDLDNNNSIHLRVSGLWRPANALSILLRAEYAQAREHEREGKSILDPNPDPWQETSDWPGRFIYDQRIAAAIVTYSFSSATLKSLSSWQTVDQGTSVNEGGLDLSLSYPSRDIQWFLHDSKNITEELNLSSDPGGRWDWLVGAFLLNGRLRAGYNQYFNTPGNTFAPDELSVTNPPPDLVNAVYDGTLYESSGLQHRYSYSAYGQATYHASDALRLTAGFRYTYDYNNTTFSDYYDLFSAPVVVHQTDTKVTYRIAADLDLSTTSLGYASVATGFKPGGGNIAATPAVVPFQFQPETILAYEVGSKNTFFTRRVLANLAGFFYVDHDMQYQAEDLINYQGGVDNIPATHVYGLESESSVLLPWSFRIDASATWEEGRITSHFLALDNVSGNAANQEFIDQYGYAAFESVVFTGSPALNALRLAAYRDVYGNSPPSLPEWASSISISQAFSLPNGASLLTRVSEQYRADYADTIFGRTPIYTAPSYAITRLLFDYRFAHNAAHVSLAINNLTDTAAVLSRFTNEFGGETTQQYYPPREVILSAGYRL